ncbi:hypothetical protein ZYGR_0AD00280 [Zygosaccharomyces rouxii]|uniref:Uncharacterized protein n=1 Tax=Zygosaccharomyces rouxii TaxID=4956 RepID=A0A1Q3A539_ZYGRO|nr:hypothetical protein ZYGR_0AD00280 [Zygosaccharomyces rouxii]
MRDPREVLNNDLYEVLTSEGEEENEIEAQIAEIERQKKDLLQRLNVKKTNPKPLDPNLSHVQVESSPKKVTNSVLPPTVQQQEPRGEVRNENLNELKAQSQEQIPANTTSFFIEKYSTSKRKQDYEVRAQEDLLSNRVHTFQGARRQDEYKPIPTNELEEFSNLWISKRYIPKEEQRSIFAYIKILRLSKLFAKVKPPKFNEPPYSNWAVIGLISNKGEVKFTSAASPKKYFKFTLTNFQYSIDTYIFGKEGVERYYNLRVGDIIAILNPQVLPWRPSGTKAHIKSFNLRISHKFECILEIGASRDLGWCPMFNKSKNEICRAPINKDKEDCCEYHRELKFRSTNAKRVELSGTYALGAPTRIDAQPALYRGGSSQKNLNYNIITNGADGGSNKEINPLDINARHFSNRNAAKAFFDERFQNPETLRNLENKRRKLRDNRKSNILNRELKKNSELDIKHKSAEEIDEIKRTTESTMGSGMMKNLGFDPTQGKIASVFKHQRSDSDKKPLTEKDSSVASLLSFKKDNVKLKPSKEILIKQKRRRERVWKEHFGSGGDEKDDSDSDLEIVS